MSVNVVERWWEVLDQVHERLQSSAYIAPYVNVRDCSPELLFRLAGWFHEVGSLLERGAELKGQHGQDR